MKVILANRTVYPFHPAGGIEKNVHYLSRALVRAGADVEVVASRPAGGERAADIDGVHYTFLEPRTTWEPRYALRPSLGIFAYSLNLARYLCGRRYDILHTFGTLPYAYLHLPGRRPVVYQPFEEVFTLDLAPGLHLGPQQQLMVAMKKHLDRAILARADAVAYTSASEAEALRRAFRIGDHRLIRIPAGIELGVIERAARCRKPRRASLGLSQENYVVACVSRLVPEKGIANLVDAFAEVVGRIPQARLLIMGDGPEGPRINRMVHDLGLTARVQHLRALPEADLYGLLSQCDCYVCPGLDLYWSQSVLEAMACGLPLVSTTHRQWVQEGENGYLVPPGDPSALASAIVQVFDRGQGREMGAISRRLAAQYDFGAMADQALTGYEWVLAWRARERGLDTETDD